MKITYDPETDALYIGLRETAARDAIDVEEGVTVDLDDKGHIIGIEILDASDRLSPEELSSIHYENLLLTMDEEPPIQPARKPRKAPQKPARVGSARARK